MSNENHVRRLQVLVHSGAARPHEAESERPGQYHPVAAVAVVAIRQRLQEAVRPVPQGLRVERLERPASLRTLLRLVPMGHVCLRSAQVRAYDDRA